MSAAGVRERVGAWTALVCLVALTACLAVYARGWESDNRVQTWTRHDAPDVAYERLIGAFGGDEIVLVRCDGFTPDDERALEWLEQTGPRLARYPAVERCADPLHVPGVTLAASPEQLTSAAEQPLVRALDLVDPRRARVDFLLQVNAAAPEAERALLAERLEELVTTAQDSGIRVRNAGHPLVASLLDREGRRVDTIFAPLLALAALLATCFALRSLPLGALSVLLAALASVGTRSALRWVGWESNLILVSCGPLCFVIVLATAMHIVAGWKWRHAAGASPNAAAAQTVRSIGWASFFAALTTAIGFGVFVFSPIEAVRRLGIAVALAVCVFVPIVFLCVPWLLAGLPLPRARAEHVDTHWLGRLPFLALRWRGWLWGVCALVLLCGAWAPTQLQKSTSALDFFPSGHPLKASFVSIESEGGAVTTLDVLIDAESSTEIGRLIDADLGARLVALAGVRGVFGPEVVRAQLVASAGPAARFLLEPALREAGRLGGKALTLRWTVRVESGGIESMRAMHAQLSLAAQAFAAAHAREAFVAGTLLRVLSMQDSLVETLIASIALNVGATLILFLFAVKSAREFIAATLANLLPVAGALCAAWALGFHLDAATVMVSSVILGLAVDNTFHVLYASGRTRGRGNVRSVSRALREVGHPATVSSISLAVGFGVLMFSGFAPTAHFGGLTALGMLISLAGALLFLPAFWLRAPRAQGKGGGDS
jgi:uncharacterized protein